MSEFINKLDLWIALADVKLEDGSEVDKAIISEMISEQPVLEVTRCGFCKYFEEGQCQRWINQMKPEDFCSLAEELMS